jgi:photoactive yellow protein
MSFEFNDPDMYRLLNGLTEVQLDDVPFGVVGLNAQNLVEVYNAHESKYGGLGRNNVLNRPFFTEIGPCMNNYLVAERFEEQAPVDITMPYVLTFRMRPTPVQLRLLSGLASSRRWVLIRRE